MRIQNTYTQTRLVKLPNASLGWLTGVVHSYETGRVLGVQVRSIIDRKERLVSRECIREITEDTVELTTWEELPFPEEAGGLRSLRVIAVESRIRIGTVGDVVWDSETGDLIQLYVDAPWWCWWHPGYSIPRQAIIEITAQGIVVEHYQWYKIGKLVPTTAPIG